MSRMRLTLTAMLSSPLASSAGLGSFSERRICTIECSDVSGFVTSWQTPATMKPSAASRAVWISAPCRRCSSL